MKIIQEIDYESNPENWADIPFFDKTDSSNPEWEPTPVIQIADNVFVKNEAVNPTGTIKDRVAWELTTLFRDFARTGSTQILRYSILTAGNVGTAISESFRKYGLPPIKMLVDENISANILDSLKKLYADIYSANLSVQLTPNEIKRLTNNVDGIDITSAMIVEPHAIFYDWHVHEAFNEEPNEIYVPYGSGRLMENYLTWQFRNARSKDSRLQVPVNTVLDISILGAEPSKKSIADKLSKDHNPFTAYDTEDMAVLSRLAFSGQRTGKYFIADESIQKAYELMSQFCETELSACAGLALYLQRLESGAVNPRDKVLVINTGKGVEK